MKKTIFVLLAVALLTLCLAAPISAANHPFTDVPDNAWYAGNVQFVYEKGLMAGTDTDKFSPETKMNRAMLVTVLYRMDGSHAASGTTPFTDIQTKQYYYPALVWAYGNGIINGTAPDKFSPEDPITREMMVTIFYRYAQFKCLDVSRTADLSKYTDAGMISDYAKAPFRWAVAAGVIFGNSATTLNPLGTATRAECAAILQRFYGLTQSTTDPTEPEPTECNHEWAHYDAVYHTDSWIVCQCGWVCHGYDLVEGGAYAGMSFAKAWDTHLNEFSIDDQLDYHASYKNRHETTLVEPEKWVCVRCGLEVESDPCPDKPEAPTEHVHCWTCVDVPEEGHWVGAVQCTCGEVFEDSDGVSATDKWIAHVKSFSGREALNHDGNRSVSYYVVDKTAARYWWCPSCGAVLDVDSIEPTEPEHCHSWQCYHEEEVGYWVPAIQCSCGDVFEDPVNLDYDYVLDLWQEHVSSFSGRDKLDHDGHRDVSYYVIKDQAYDYWVCVIPNCPYDGEHFIGEHP